MSARGLLVVLGVCALATAAQGGQRSALAPRLPVLPSAAVRSARIIPFPASVREVSGVPNASKIDLVDQPEFAGEATQAAELARLAPVAGGGIVRSEVEVSRAAAKVYDGATNASETELPSRQLEPVFEPSTFKVSGPSRGGNDKGGRGGEGSGGGQGGGSGGDVDRRPTLSFGQSYVSALMAVDQAKAIYGQIRVVRDNPGSKTYWNTFKKGVAIDIRSKGEDVFGRTTTVTKAYTKPIGKLTREDLAGTIPNHQLKATIRQLRQALIDQLDDSRSVWHPNDDPISLKTRVRVVKFKSYLQLFKETNGPDAIPPVETPALRVPLEIKPEGPLEPLAAFLPRAVFLDLDLFDAPISKELVADMAKLQRTGVYFVAFSRKLYAEAGSLKDKLIRQLSGYHLSTLLPIRFMAVTDDGAVISVFPKGGSVAPVDVAAYTEADLDVLRDAARKASELVALTPRSTRELEQEAVDGAADNFPGFAMRQRAFHKDPGVRFQLAFAKNVTDDIFAAWLSAFKDRLAAQGLAAQVGVSRDAAGARTVSVRRTTLAAALPRLLGALGEQFGVYLNPSDVLVLSADPALTAFNPSFDFGALTGLKGPALVENALGVMLGEHRENRAGDLTGSASRMAQFTRDRARYLSELLIEQNKSEMAINFFSGHVVHSVNDWFVYQLQNGKRPTKEEYAAHFAETWDAGLRERKAVGLPKGETMRGWRRESLQRGFSMYDHILASQGRGEVLVGTEIPNFFIVRDHERRTGAVKRRYILHTIFDFVALRPDPAKPGHATIVIYDFKTGPAQSREKLAKDVQVLTYALFAHRRWVGKTFPVPYFSGKGGYVIDEARVEFMYNGVKQETTQSSWDLDGIRRTIISKLNQIYAAESKLFDERPVKKARNPRQKS